MNAHIDQMRQAIVETAHGMLEGRVSFIEGARAIVARLGEAKIDQFDPDILPFVEADSETDNLPVGEVQKLWSDEGLAQLAPKTESLEAWANKYCREACAKLIRRFDTRDDLGMPIYTSDNPTTVYRPVGPKELELIRKTGNMAFPRRLPDQPIFYPVTTEEYAVKIARDWNVPAYGAGYVTRFKVRRDYLSRYPVQNAAGSIFQEYWIPAADIPEFNRNIVGEIEIIVEFHRNG